MTAPAKEAEEPTTTSEWVCAGERVGGDGKLRQLWYKLDGNGRLLPDERANFGKGGLRGTHAHGVFELTWTGDSVKLGGEHAPAFVRRWPSKEDVAEWEALSLAAKTAVRLRARAKEDKSWSATLEALEPLRRAMRKTDAAGRRAIKVAVLEYLDHA